VTTPAFSDLGLVEPLLRAVREEAYASPTPIQAQAIPYLLEGRDLLGCARTGTGKTAAFVLPMLQRLTKGRPHREGRALRSTPGSARALVLVPTRELAAQVRQSLVTYGRHLHPSTAVVYGGVGQGPQVRALSRGVDVLVATPGRLLDLMGQRHARLDHVEILVLDEADQMLDLGFLPDMRRILDAVPAKRQTLLFSATMPPAIAALARRVLTRPAEVFVSPVASTVDEVDQKVYFVDPKAKPALLLEVLSDPQVQRALVFTRTKRGADRVARGLVQSGIHAAAIHGNKAQNARERALEGFRRGRTPVLVATDIAARGIDVDGISHVVNYELPNVPESYVHRIGRTARAGNTGVAISLCGPEERAYLHDIERLTRRKVTVVGSRHPHAIPSPDRPRGFGAVHASSHPAARSGSGRGSSRRRGRSAPPRNHGHRAWSPRPRPPVHAEPERKAPFGAGAGLES
jgi:ATP-dependent RNA helicase RhlE